MSIGESMANVWHNHPYVILGAGGLVALYFLWPSSSSNAAAPNTDYANQLAAETALSQSQLAEQAQTNQAQIAATAAERTALLGSEGQTNQAIAAANAAGIVANQNAQAAVDMSWKNANATNFNALTAGLMDYGHVSMAGAKTAQQSALAAFLASMGATFSMNQDGINLTGGVPGQSDITRNSSSGVDYTTLNTTHEGHGFGTAGGGGGGGWGMGFSSQNVTDVNSSISQHNWLSGVTNSRSYIPSIFGTNYNNAQAVADTAFNHSNNLLGSLWNNMILTYIQQIHIAPPTLNAPPQMGIVPVG